MSNNAADITAEIILKTIKENNMLVYGDRIVTGVSGGADSLHPPAFCEELHAAHNALPPDFFRRPSDLQPQADPP